MKKKNQQQPNLRIKRSIQVYDHAMEEEKRREVAEELAATFKESLSKEKECHSTKSNSKAD